MDINELVASLKEVDEGLSFLKEESIKSRIQLKCKVVYHDLTGQRYLKVIDTSECILYHKVISTCQNLGTNFFLPFEILYQGRFLSLITQPELKISFIEDVVVELAKRKDSDLVLELIRQLRIKDILPHNCGINSKNEIQCFDFEMFATESEVANFISKSEIISQMGNKGQKEAITIEFKDLSALLTELKHLEDKFKAFPSMNGQPFEFFCKSKSVFKGNDGRIYRMENKIDVIQRIMVREYFKNQGFPDIFLIEEFLPDLSLNAFAVTVQPEVEVLTLSDEEALREILKDYSEKNQERISQMFSDLGLMAFGRNNCGRAKDGKVKIFDFVSNTAVGINGERCFKLLDSKGGTLIDV